MKHTEQSVKDELKKFLNEKEIEKIYDENFIKRKGKTEGTYYSEIIASELLNKIDSLYNIVSIKRESNGKSYLTKSHQNKPLEIKKTNREEEKCAKRLFNKKDIHIGEVIDFQIPLKNKQSDKLGKIDLMIFNKNTLTLYLIELKFGKNNETLLRAILEAYTYSKIINKDKLKSDFGLNEIKNIKPAVMVVCPDCNSYKELEDIKNRPELLKLAKKLDITFFKSADENTFETISSDNP